MDVHQEAYTAVLSVWVPVETAGLVTWHTCATLGDSFGEEIVYGCEEVRALFMAHGRLLCRLLADQPYKGFRIIIRRKDTGALVGGGQWDRSKETNALRPLEDFTFSSCEWGPGACKLAA